MSIRARLVLGAVLASLCLAGLGAYAVHAIGRTNDLLDDAYDMPVAALNSSRAASVSFAAMERHAGRAELATSIEERGLHLPLVRESRRRALDQLQIARDSALTPEERETVADIALKIGEWETLHSILATNGLDQEEWKALDRATDHITGQFEFLAALVTGDGFASRQAATQKKIDDIQLFTFLLIAATIILCLLISYAISRQILRPLRAAVDAADRIAHGDLDTPIPVTPMGRIGSLLHSMSIMQSNLSKRMTREAKIRESAQARLIDVLENSSEAIILADADDEIIVVNSQVNNFFPGARDILRPQQQLGEALDKIQRLGLIAPQIPDKDTPLYPCPGTPPSERCVTEMKLVDGRCLRFGISRTAHGETIAIWSDMSEAMEREGGLRAAKEAAESASRAKSRFLASISHELRTPLNAIIGFSEIIKKEMLGPIGNKDYPQYADDILSSGLHLLQLINDILDLSKSEAGALILNLAVVDSAVIVEACRRIMRDQCERAGVQLLVKIAPHTPVFEADPQRIKQILLNLLSNSVKFTPQGGTIEVTAEAGPDDGLYLSVADTGIGIASQDIPLAFQPFAQIDSELNRHYQGTGLGLPLTKTLVELHNGRLDLKSEVGKGTTVIIWLPRCAPSATS